MRLDARTMPYDPRCMQVKEVWLDDVMLPPGTVLMGDEEAGEVMLHVVKDGHVVTNGQGEYQTETRRGVVKFVMKPTPNVDRVMTPPWEQTDDALQITLELSEQRNPCQRIGSDDPFDGEDGG